MAGQAQGTRRRTVVLGLAGLLLPTACGAPEPRDTASRDVQRVLDRRAGALLGRDEPGYLAALAPGAGLLRESERARFRNLTQVPLRSWEYRLTELRRDGDRATARAELRYRFEGYDSAPVTTSRAMELTRHDGRWYVVADRPDQGAAQQLWEQGPVTAVRGTRSLVLGTGQERQRLREIAATADRGVPAVDAAWPVRWSGRVVVLVPGSLDGMAALLGASSAGYRGIAAVTTGVSGAQGSAPADRVIINPEAYGAIGEFGQRVVLTHETAHVATRAHTSPATPMWLSEGFADWAAYRGTGRTPDRIAPELHRAVLRGELPAILPEDKEFGFAGDSERLARAYEGGWAACTMIAERWGEERLTAFYRAVGAGKDRESATKQAMHRELGVTPEEFTDDWRDYVRRSLS
ncbi:hypothetical protein [Streptomyces sannanensis]